MATRMNIFSISRYSNFHQSTFINGSPLPKNFK
jgi:hypothetical protein